MEKISAKHKQGLESIFRQRWTMTAVMFMVALIGAYESFRRRSEFAHFPTYHSLINGTIFHTAWISVFNAVAGPFVVFMVWNQVRRYRSLLAQEESERFGVDHSAKVWPPAPRI